MPSKVLLMLHGYDQNDIIFRKQTSALRKKCLKLGLKCVYLRGPFSIDDTEEKPRHLDEENDSERRCWANKRNTEQMTTSAQFIFHRIDLINTAGDRVVGVLGFSQGSCMIDYLLRFNVDSKSSKPIQQLRFAILCAGFPIMSQGTALETLDHIKQTRLLHIFGTTDQIVTQERSKSLVELYEGSETLIHTGGHHLPQDSTSLKAILEFITRNITS